MFRSNLCFLGKYRKDELARNLTNSSLRYLLKKSKLS